MKRLITLTKKAKSLVSLFLLLCVAGMNKGLAYDFYQPCSTGQMLYYNITDATQRYVEITCPGTPGTSGWNGYTKPTGNITLPTTVTYNSATYTVRAIGRYAFYGCTGLTGSLAIPAYANTIGQDAFKGCTGFTGTLTIGAFTNTIGYEAFANCSGFTGSLELPGAVQTLDFYAFSGCTGFTGTLTVNAGLTAIGQGVFKNCNFSQVNYGAPNCSAPSSSYKPFENCGGTLTITEGVQSIPGYMFSGAGFTGQLTISSSVTSIGAYAFKDCSGFTSMRVYRETPPTLGTSPFSGVPTSIPVYVPCAAVEAYQAATQWSSFTNYQCLGYGFSAVCSTGQKLYYNIIDATNNYVEITYPGPSTSSPWTGFTKPSGSITLPSSVTYNGVTYTVTKIGDYAFSGCTGLTGALTIPSSVTAIGNSTFSSCRNMTGALTIPDSVVTIGNSAFSSCYGFSGSLTIGNSVTTIGPSAFYGCNGFAGTGALTFGQSVTTIGMYAFGDCGSFTSIRALPVTPPSLGTSVFYGLPSDIPMYVPCAAMAAYQAAAQWSSYSNYQCLGYDFSAVCSTGQTLYYNIIDATNHYVEITYPGTSTSNPWNSNPWAGYTQPSGNIILPNSVTYNGTTYAVIGIGDCAFYDCNSMTGSLTIPNSVVTIGWVAFRGCTGFTGSLTIGNSVTTIGGSAFRGCTGFTGSLTIPNSVTAIGSTAFEECSGFTGSLTIGNSVTAIDSFAFMNCSGFTGLLTIGNSVTTIGTQAFYGCHGFTGSLTIPNSVTAIGNSAFSSVFTSMTVLPETPPTLSSGAFYNVPADIPVYVPCAALEDYQSASGWSAFTNMQCFETLTVYDGIAKNNRIPAYVFFFDDFTRSQFVIPAAELADMKGTPVTSMTFYTTSQNVPYTAVSSADVYLKEVDYTEISAYEPKSSATTVYSGYLDIVSAGSGGEMTIHFSTPYNYQGGNLLIGVENTQDVDYKNIYFYGQTVSGASISGSNGSSPEAIPAQQQNFIPKTTFNFMSRCPSEDLCQLTFTLTDSYGDTWNGNAIKVIDVATNTVLATMTNVTYDHANAPITETYTLAVCDGRELRFEWEDGQWSSECSYTIATSYGTIVLQGTGNDGLSTGDVLGTHVVNCGTMQTIELVEGWNWFSTYIELDDPVALLQMLENGMGDSGVQIESVIDGVDMNAGEEWAGDLMSIGLVNEHTYMIEVTEDVTVELQGPVTDPADHPITIYPNDYSWIGFPCSEEVDVNVALAGFEAEDGDMIETVYGEDGGVIYYYDGVWVGDFDTMIPGRGYIYFSNSDEEKTLVFQSHAYVDLGLPSGLLWATCNVGANAPEEYGDYFAWGETQPKNVYNGGNYQYNVGGSLTKYTGSDGLTTLLPEDDAATANWGGNWRMPTKEEFEELYNNTTVIWTTQKGVNGRLFTASNGNSLFLPAAGGRWGDELDNDGNWGYYWLSSLLTSGPYNAWAFDFNSGECGLYNYVRDGGFTVRPVREN